MSVLIPSYVRWWDYFRPLSRTALVPPVSVFKTPSYSPQSLRFKIQLNDKRSMGQTIRSYRMHQKLKRNLTFYNVQYIINLGELSSNSLLVVTIALNSIKNLTLKNADIGQKAVLDVLNVVKQTHSLIWHSNIRLRKSFFQFDRSPSFF